MSFQLFLKHINTGKGNFELCVGGEVLVSHDLDAVLSICSSQFYDFEQIAKSQILMFSL